MSTLVSERVEDLEDAREALVQAIELIEQATRHTPVESYADAYIIPTLRMCASDDHTYLGHQPANIDELICALEDGEE